KLRQGERLRLTVHAAPHTQCYNAFGTFVLRNGLHQNDPHEPALLAVAAIQLEALQPQAGLAVRRRDDAAVEGELLLLSLYLRFERREGVLEPRVGLAVDVHRRREDRDFALQLVDRLRLLGGLRPITLEPAPVI